MRRRDIRIFAILLLRFVISISADLNGDEGGATEDPLLRGESLLITYNI
jgi:hypothetical protein